MIYEVSVDTDPIRQGDIFMGLPRVDLSLTEMIVVGESGEQATDWLEIAKRDLPTDIIVSVRPVIAIVVTQNCDALRSRDITLCEIRSFREVELKSKNTTAPKKWKNIITQQARINQKWFYLPPDNKVGFSDKMGVDFLVTLRVHRKDLEGFRSLRKGRLNSIAREHFRERIAEFFRRYAYNEWYPLDIAEMDAYSKEYPEAIPFAWQESPRAGRESGK